MKRSLTLIFTIIILNVSGQEVLTGLTYNPVIGNIYAQSISNNQHLKSSVLKEWSAVELPFFDDFSDYTGYPDTNLWINNEVYVNNDFPYFSVNLGAATLDVIDSRGFVYSNASIFPFEADHLTSRPIRLDSVFNPFPQAIRVSDSVYFSFFYQPQGRAYEPPEPNDSLVLQFGHYGIDSTFEYIDSTRVPISLYIGPSDTIFPGDTLYTPCDVNWGTAVFDTLYYDDFVMLPCDSVYFPSIEWENIWSAPGMHIDSFYSKYGTYSRQVLIPIKDSVKYFRNDFFFRFYNYASLAEYQSEKSNCDEWNVDFVYLNIGRSLQDTIYRNIGFVERSPSILRNYESMPYDQYIANPTNMLKDTLKLYISNLSNTTFNTIYKYTLENESGTYKKIYDGGSCNLQPFSTDGYQNCQTCWQHACPPWKYLFPLDVEDDYAIFNINHILLGDITSADTIHDTLKYQQRFWNYYAYDDGTPEDGYGLIPAGAKLAVKYRINRPDTLLGIQMFFNRTQNNGNDMYFDLVVWRDNNGIPGEEIYRQYYEKPKFSKSIYEIQTYDLDSAVPVNNTFYIGWEQSESKILNVGFDRYNDAREFTFYNTVGTWNQSQFSGAIIMRPVLGDEIITNIPYHPEEKPEIRVYPNPAGHNSSLNIQLKGLQNTGELQMSIYNSFGQKVKQIGYKSHIDLNAFPPGVYFLLLHNSKENVKISEKFVIAY